MIINKDYKIDILLIYTKRILYTGLIFLSIAIVYYIVRAITPDANPTKTNQTTDITPYNMQIVYESDSCVRLEWQTLNKTIGYVKIGEEINKISVTIPDQEGYTINTDHTVLICGLNPSKTYYALVGSNGQLFGIDSEPILLNQ